MFEPCITDSSVELRKTTFSILSFLLCHLVYLSGFWVPPAFKCPDFSILKQSNLSQPHPLPLPSCLFLSLK